MQTALVTYIHERLYAKVSRSSLACFCFLLLIYPPFSRGRSYNICAFILLRKQAKHQNENHNVPIENEIFNEFLLKREILLETLQKYHFARD